MIRGGLAATLLLLGVSSTFAQGTAQKANDPLSVSPEQAVKEAMAAGDKRFLLAPSCNELLPGFPLNRNPFVGPDKVAMRSLAKCEEFMGPEQHKRMQAIHSYAERYNHLLFEALQKQTKGGKWTLCCTPNSVLTMEAPILGGPHFLLETHPAEFAERKRAHSPFEGMQQLSPQEAEDLAQYFAQLQ
jgi:hypothetical protein